MKTKLENNLLHGEVRKRDLQSIISAYIWTFLFFGWTISTLLASIKFNFWSLPIEEIFPTFIFFNMFTIFCFIGSYVTIRKDEKIRTFKFLIHEYERWNTELIDYETKYVIEKVELTASYLFHKHIGDYIEVMSVEELKSYCNNQIPYETKEKAMIKILEKVKKFITEDKNKVKQGIKNIKTIENLTVEEIKEKLSNGDFNYLFKNQN